ncbi:MAG TPA: saccharopine dehydrogenase NADP-binding domain-containing protein [Pseudomonadales bacterium]|nr:saccharopine dehydrogenase NADP-binding domain-containing protein [Pseudomonadales bacterium]
MNNTPNKVDSDNPGQPQTAARPYDLVVYGAAGFVGRLLAHYIHQRAQQIPNLRWAIAGRSMAKLEAVKLTLGAPELPVIIADAADPAALRVMAAQTKVIASTVGPYALYGSELVAACAECGTDYCDLTGEVPWMRRMIDAHSATAQRSGARIVHTCGFDSIPSDMGVWYTQQQAQRRFGTHCTQIKFRLKSVRGGFSGGTVASLLNVMKESNVNPALRHLLRNPYALAPNTDAAPQQDSFLPEFDTDAKQWQAPFIMSVINTRVVHRTHALLGRPWGKQFRYDEAMLTGRGLPGRLAAYAVSGGFATLLGLTAFRFSRPLVEKLLPAPGEGPSEKLITTGFYDVRLFGRTANGQKLQTKLTGKQDPGYGATSKMLGESALCLAFDISREKVPGGFWTPATAMGDALLQRLEQFAGMHFECVG